MKKNTAIKVLIIDDDQTHSNHIKIGIQAYNKNITVIETYQNIQEIVKAIKNNEIGSYLFPDEVNLYIIDVALTTGDEYGLILFNFLQDKYKNKFKYIVTSQWDIREFKTNVNINSDFFINKNLFSGYEIQYPIKRLTKKRLNYEYE